MIKLNKIFSLLDDSFLDVYNTVFVNSYDFSDFEGF